MHSSLKDKFLFLKKNPYLKFHSTLKLKVFLKDKNTINTNIEKL
jgi:hypothetical protein